MSNRLPITLGLFTSTKGHWGHRDVYRATVNHWDKQIPLALWGAKVAHVKVTPGDEAIAADMETWLTARGFKVLKTMGNWQRGPSHQAAYMADMVTMSKEPLVTSQPFFLLLEDDSTMHSHVVSPADLWLQSAQMLAADNELVSVRLLRRGDLSTTVIVPEEHPIDRGYFHGEHFNLQPLILRSRDFYLACITLEGNPMAVQSTQCEMLWRMILRAYSRSPLLHRVYHPDYAETTHLGVEAYPQIARDMGLVTT